MSGEGKARLKARGFVNNMQTQFLEPLREAEAPFTRLLAPAPTSCNGGGYVSVLVLIVLLMCLLSSTEVHVYTTQVSV